MSNSYTLRQDYSFWKRSVSGRREIDVDPVTQVPFRISRIDRVATSGSCFAQHISRTLVNLGFTYLVTEHPPGGPDPHENYGVFPARFANIYSARQLMQLFQRAYNLFEPLDVAWKRSDGAFIDPFRPRIQERGFHSIDALIADRESHLASVREMFESCDVFIFTLGLTEAWQATRDGAVFPLAPGVVATDVDPQHYAFHNFAVDEVVHDLSAFIEQLKIVNPAVRVILTVSPVPLIATYEDRHVLVSTTYSKSVLRVAADIVSRSKDGVAYFPSYEIITGPQSRGAFYEDDLREVKPEGVAHVMNIFARHYLSETIETPARAAPLPHGDRAEELSAIRELEKVICEEEILETSR
jgi:GSCFA family